MEGPAKRSVPKVTTIRVGSQQCGQRRLMRLH
jgi:hypothetical protein